MIGSYPKVFAIGHAAIPELFLGPVLVEEKVDGSQFSFGIEGDHLEMRSKGAEVFAGEKSMFSKAIETATALLPLLTPGWIYRCEYLRTPKHNTLVYDRVPNQHLILFDITIGMETFMPYKEKALEAMKLGLEIVPKLYEGVIQTKGELLGLLDRVSILGGQQIEGMVVKNYAQFGTDKHVQMGKYVREDFKELNSKAWRSDPDKTTIDIKEKLGLTYNTPARWEKAIQHLKEAGKLEGSPRDIGNLIEEVKRDVVNEEHDAISKALLKWALPQILRIAAAGLPEWYKQKLLDSAFKTPEVSS